MVDTRSADSRNGRGGTRLLFAVLVSVALLAVGFGIAPATAQEDKDVEATFEAIGQEGFVEINSEELEEPIQFPTPEEVDQPISVDGEIYADGTWRAPKEDISFPTLEVFGSVEVQLEAVEDFTGTIDREAGTMSLDAAIEITVSGESIEVGANLTSGTSNDLEGSAEGLDTDSATVTLVDNEFTIPQTTGTVADSAIGLPSTEPGTNWFSLTLDVDIQEEDGGTDETGTVSGVVTDGEGDPVAGATVSAGGAEATTGSDGSYELDAPAGTQDVTVDADGFESATRSLEVTAGGTATLDVTLDALELGTVSGVVTDGDGNPIEGATVSAGGAETTTGGDGSYELELAAGTQDVAVEADGFESTTESVDVQLGTTATLDVQLESDVGKPNFRADSIDVPDVDPGDTANASATITNVGEGPGEQEVTLSVGPENETFTVQLGVNEAETLELEWETTEDDQGSFDALLETSNDSISTTFLVGEPQLNLEDADFVAESTGGYITFDEDGYGAIEDDFGVGPIENREDVRAAFESDGGPGLALPDVTQGDEPILIAGKINDDGTWEEVDSFFPVLRDDNYPFDGFVRTLEPFTGKIDMDEGLLTAESRFRVFVDGREDATFEFDVNLTSEGSGDIPVSFAEFGEQEGQVHIVSNNYPVNDQTGDGIIDAELSLPSTEPDRNYLELAFDVDLDPDPEDYGGAFDQDNPGDQLGNSNSGDDDGGSSTIVTAGQGLGALAVLVALGFVGTTVYVRVNGSE